MDDLWLLLQAEDTLKDYDGWGTVYKADPQDWGAPEYKEICCVVQQLLGQRIEREEEAVRKLRRFTSRKRAANREK